VADSVPPDAIEDPHGPRGRSPRPTPGERFVRPAPHTPPSAKRVFASCQPSERLLDHLYTKTGRRWFGG
jgi:hypothetical protein